MTELTRFQQLRPAQKISEEEKQQVGLALYRDDSLSGFGMSLRASKSSGAYREVVERFKKANTDSLITNTGKINPLIRALYDLFDFKARPIKLDDFKAFAKTLTPGDAPSSLEDEWRRYADNLILAVEEKTLGTNFCVDFQLLIRICHILRRTLTLEENNEYAVVGDASGELVHQLLSLPILLPDRTLNSRCSRDCSNQRPRMEIPRGNPDARINDRNP